MTVGGSRQKVMWSPAVPGSYMVQIPEPLFRPSFYCGVFLVTALLANDNNVSLTLPQPCIAVLRLEEHRGGTLQISSGYGPRTTTTAFTWDCIQIVGCLTELGSQFFYATCSSLPGLCLLQSSYTITEGSILFTVLTSYLLTRSKDVDSLCEVSTASNLSM